MGVIEDFSEDQRRALLVLAFHMMVADHEAVPPEQSLVDQLEQQLGLNGTLVPTELFNRPDDSVFRAPDVRALVLAKLAAVAVADGRQHVNEVDFLVGLAARFDIDGDKLARIIAWAALPAAARPDLAEHLGE